MSIDRNIYVGPIARCKYPTRTEDVVVERRCANGHATLAYGKDKFCGACGAPISATTKPKSRAALDPLSDMDRGFELFPVDDMDDGGKAFPKGEHVYVVNMQRKGKRPFHLDEEYAHFTTVSTDQTRAETEWFRQEYAKSLAMLAKHYGAEPVVEWAILRWSS